VSADERFHAWARLAVLAALVVVMLAAMVTDGNTAYDPFETGQAGVVTLGLALG
jgi:hypothetical protein